jgi:hypothetical protein
MADPENPIVSQPSPDTRGRFSWPGLALAIAGGAAAGVVWAWTGEVIQSYVAPLILFPILLGVFAGLSIVGLVRLLQIGNRPTILLAVVLASAVAGLGQHYFEYCAQYSPFHPMLGGKSAAEQNLSPLVEELKPSFVEFLEAQARRGRPLLGEYRAQGWAAWLSWAIDAMLVVAGAVVVTIPSLRVSYCNRCGTWYRTIRCGKIDLPTAKRLAALIDAEEIEHLHSPRYRLSCCHGGCGPTRCELSWEDPGGGIDLVRVWLAPDQRNQVASVLDGFPEDEIEES